MRSQTQQDNELRATSFAKIINHETGMMVIPEQFVRMHANAFRENQKLFLRVPPGTMWEMRLKNEADGLILNQGAWSQFMKFYKIEIGHQLVFSYKGCCMVDVVIFDDTATEIMYPFRCNCDRENATPEVEEQDDVEDEEEEEAEAEEEDDDDDDDEDEEEDDNDDDYDGDECNQVNISHKRPRVDDSGSWKTGGSRKGVVGASPSASRSKNPHFRVVIAETYLTSCYGLHVPTKFASEYIGEEVCPAKLYNHGRFWKVHFSFRKSINQERAKITTGWKKFAQDTRLKVGDVCTFYLVKRGVPLHFRVAVFRSTGLENLSTPGGHSANQSKSSVNQFKSTKCSVPASKHKASRDSRGCNSSRIFHQRSVHFGSENSECPMFYITMTEHYIRRWNVPIKTSFLKHLKNEQTVTLQVGNKEWTMKAYCYPNKKGILSNGWYKFQWDNDLQVGDTCVFKLIHKKNMVFRVSILQANV